MACPHWRASLLFWSQRLVKLTLSWTVASLALLPLSARAHEPSGELVQLAAIAERAGGSVISESQETIQWYVRQRDCLAVFPSLRSPRSSAQRDQVYEILAHSIARNLEAEPVPERQRFALLAYTTGYIRGVIDGQHSMSVLALRDAAREEPEAREVCEEMIRVGPPNLPK